MNCSEAEHFFDAYLDGELAGSLRLEFDAHRLRCTVCQQKLAMMEACEHILAHDARGPTLSDDFTDRVMNEVGQRRIIAQHSRKRRIMITAAVGLQAAAVIVFAVLWAGYWNQPAPPVLEPGADVAFVARVGDAIAEKDRVKLTELMFARRNQYVAARSNLKDEMNGLFRYAAGFSILDDLSFQPAPTPSPWSLFPAMLAPTPVEETEPAPSAAGSYSL